jgi:hypothetical protein
MAKPNDLGSDVSMGGGFGGFVEGSTGVGFAWASLCESGDWLM